MSSPNSPPLEDVNEEIPALIDALHESGQRLEELTGGEVDGVADRDGRTFLLQSAQDQLRHSEAARQADILNALPANIALLDARGLIVSVNEAWRRFGSANAIQDPGHGIGVNYLEICDQARGDGASEAHQAAEGIRSVLAGAANSFSIEYPCHSTTEQRWFLMMATPLAAGGPNGAVVMHLNITARKRGEEALQRFRSAMDAAADGIFFLNRSTMRFVDVNSAACNMLGYSREELFQMGPTQLGAGTLEQVQRVHDAIIAGDGTNELTETQLRRKDGSYVQVEVRRHAQRSGADWIVVGVVRDITERQEAEKRLRDSELRFREMAENIHDVFFLRDADGNRIIYVSPAYEEIWGRSRESLYANPESWVEAIHPDDRASTYEKYKQGMLAGKYELEYRIVRPDGSIRWIEGRVFSVRDKAGKVVRMAGVAKDVTRRKRSDQKFKDLLEFAPDPMVIANGDSEIVLVNAQAVKLFGWHREELLGQKIDILVPERFRGKHSGHRIGFFAQPNARTMDGGSQLFGLRKDGSEVPVEISLSPLETDEGTLVISAVRDISERKEAAARIAYLNRVYAMLSGINTLIVRVRDRDELFREACRIAVEQGGFRMSLIAVVDRSTMKIVPTASAGVDEALLTAIKGLLSSSESASSTMIARALREKTAVVSNVSQDDPKALLGKKHGEAGVRSLAVLPLIVADEAVGVLVLYAKEIEFFHQEEMKLLTELAGDIAFAIDHIDKQERLDYLAYYDVLTGLANRRLFLERVAQYVRSAAAGGHKLALFLTDLEGFKNINDSLGRPAGDELLRQVAQWLTRNAGDANLVSRVGADVFAVVLPEVRQGGDLVRMLEKMIGAFLAHPFPLTDGIFRIAARGGVALFPDDGADADTLFRNAEAALKKAKGRGERYLFYSQEMTEAVAGKLTLENQLREALDKGEFVLHYQPKVNLVSGKVTGAEGLIRWNDPRTGLVPPGRFIPILEETGLIHDVGRWALRQALSDFLRWRAAGLPAVRIAVNVSPLQLRNRGFVDEIKQAIGIDAQAAAGLELEITESLIMADIKLSIARLQAVRALSVTIAIDDFGTGFSSLSYLARLPVDTLKIDRSFVIDMTAGPQGLALVSTIISLAHALKLKVVAEGVETEEQLRLLRLLSCDEFQGFLFSKPLPSEIFETRYLVPASGA